MRILANLFKSRATKETERFKAEAETERLKDAVETLVTHVTYKINDFCRETAFKIGSEKLNAYKDAVHGIEGSDMDAKLERLEQLAVRFIQDMDAFSVEMNIAAEKSIGELKYTFIELGSRDKLKELIELKVNQLSELLIDDGKNFSAERYLYILGVVHENGTLMTPKEVKAKHGTA